MDSYYNYTLNNGNIVAPPYTTDKNHPASNNMNTPDEVIPSHTSSISYAYRTNTAQSVPQEDFKFKGYSFNQVPFLFFQDHRKDYKSAMTDALGNLQTSSELNEIFFSQKNILYVQKEITKAIKRITKGKIIIEDQPELDILIKMQYAYYMYGRFLHTDINAQVKELNYITIKEMIPEIITQIKQNLAYIRDISRPPFTMPQPMNVNKAGRRTNRSISSIFENS
jgi:hypothetical protein